MPPRDVATRARRAPRPGAGRQGRRRRRPRASSTSPSTPRPPASSPASIVEAGADYGHNDSEAGARINLEFVSANPTGPLHIGHTRWAALGDAMCAAAQGLRRHRGHRVLHQRRRRADGQVRRVGAGPAPRASRPRRAATPATTSTSSPPRCSQRGPDLLELPDDEALAAARAIAYPAQFAGHPGHARRLRRRTSTSGSPRLRCTTPAPSSEAVARLREQGHVFDAGRRGLAAHHRLRRRQGPGHDPGQRRADLLRRATPPTTCEEGPRLRREDLPARRRPPRLHRPAEGDRGLRRRRPGPQHRDPDRPAGQPRRRQAVQAGRQHHRAARPGQLARHRRRPLLPGALPGRLPARRSTARSCASRPTRTPCSTCSTRTRGHPTSRNRGRGRRASRGRVRPVPADHATESALLGASSPSSRGSSPRPPSCASRTGSPATSRSSPATSTTGTTAAACGR